MRVRVCAAYQRVFQYIYSIHQSIYRRRGRSPPPMPMRSLRSAAVRFGTCGVRRTDDNLEPSCVSPAAADAAMSLSFFSYIYAAQQRIRGE